MKALKRIERVVLRYKYERQHPEIVQFMVKNIIALLNPKTASYLENISQVQLFQNARIRKLSLRQCRL
jgi:hypothetical protein